MGKGILLIGCCLGFMAMPGLAAQVELGLTAAASDAPAQTQPEATDATATKKPPQLGIGPDATPAAAATPAVVTRVVIQQRVVRVPAGRRAR